MNPGEIDTLDTQGDSDYVYGQLSDDELEIPASMVPPNTDDTDTLPSEIHPSYPYGNPFSLHHPAALPRKPHDFTSRALYEDMEAAYGQNAPLRWKDLALDELLPTDEQEELRLKAAQARKMASGAHANNAGAHQQAPTNEADPQEEDDDEEEEEEWDHDEPSSPVSE